METIIEGIEGPYLFGAFGIADAFYWPILWVRLPPVLSRSAANNGGMKQRFRTYAIDLKDAGPHAREWIRTMWADPKLRALGKAAFVEAANPVSAVAEYDNLWPGEATMKTFTEDEVYVPKF